MATGADVVVGEFTGISIGSTVVGSKLITAVGVGMIVRNSVIFCAPSISVVTGIVSGFVAVIVRLSFAFANGIQQIIISNANIPTIRSPIIGFLIIFH